MIKQQREDLIVNQRGKHPFSVGAKYFALLILILSLGDVARVGGSDIAIDTGELEPGDVVFRMGRGLYSTLFARIGSQPVPFSHVGIYVERDKNKYVIHTEANDLTGIGYARMEPLETFFAADRASSCSVFRAYSLTDDQKRLLLTKASEYADRQIPFDSDFDLNTADRLYCSELVWRAFMAAGMNIAPRRDSIARNFVSHEFKLEIISLNNMVNGGVLKKVF